MNVDQLWSLFYQRDTILIVLFLGPLTALGVYAAHEWHQYDRFFDAHPELRRKFEAWRHLPKPPDPHVCPHHGLRIRAGQRCWIRGCDWRSPPNQPRPR